MMGVAPTRRQLLAGGAVAGLAVIAPAAAQADGTGQSGTGLPPWVQDGKILERLLNAERLLEYGYEKALGSGHLKHDAQELALLLLAHEQAHVLELQSHLSDLHLPKSARQQQHPAHFPPSEVADLFKDVQNEKEALQGVVQIENLAESSYFTAVGSFHDRRLVHLATEILACEAQHWTMLVDLLHKGDATRAVPHPFVRGSKHIGKPHT